MPLIIHYYRVRRWFRRPVSIRELEMAIKDQLTSITARVTALGPLITAYGAASAANAETDLQQPIDDLSTAVGALESQVKLTVTVATSLPDATVGAPYTGSLSPAGGVPPYNLTISGLPTGLTADSSGNITGSVDLSVGPGTISLTVSGSDSASNSISTSVPLVIVAAAPAQQPS